jgi:beta-phosphoglucomutase-like phosphatase (HAD superfamily)
VTQDYSAVIFDLDGTLLDTERLVIEAGLSAFRQCGLPERADLLAMMVGTVGDETEAILAEAFGPGFDAAALELRWRAEISVAFAGPIPLRPGAADLLALLDDMDMPRAVATNSRTQPALANLRSSGIAHFFRPELVFGRDRVTRPKPAPDLFLQAAIGLQVRPATCLVFEDSDPGAAAALAAGMTVVQVPDQRPPATRNAHYLADSLLDGARAAGLFA